MKTSWRGDNPSQCLVIDDVIVKISDNEDGLLIIPIQRHVNLILNAQVLERIF